MNDDKFPGAFDRAQRPGVYLRIIRTGTVAAGDPIEVDPAQQPAIQISSLVKDDIVEEVLRQAVNDVRVPGNWREAATRALRTR